MNEKLLKKIIIVLIILIVIATILFVIIINTQEQGNEEKNNQAVNYFTDDNGNIIDDVPETEVLEQNKTWKEVNLVSEYYAIKNSLEDLFLRMLEAKTYEIEQLKTDAKEKVKELLSNYIEEKNITDSKLESLIEKYYEEELEIERMYYQNQGNLVYAYFVQGQLTNSKEKCNFIVILDRNTDYYTILPNEYINETYGSTLDLSKVTLSTDIIKVEKKTSNRIYYSSFNDEDMSKKYFSDYIQKLKDDYQQVYDLLDENYKQKRFGSYEKFEKYIKNNYENLTNREMSQYTISYEKNNITIYTCTDQYGNSYIFTASAVMHYTLLLDDYTIENSSFNEEYENASDLNKGLMNCKKFFKMINMKDYEAAYNLLDENFKQTYFATESRFEQYMTTNLFTINAATCNENSDQGSGEYLYKTTITDATGANSKQIQLNIVIKLDDGTNFTMYFGT